MSRENHIKRLIIEHRRRLQKLKERKAKSGDNTPPEILTEIEDIEAEIEEREWELEEIKRRKAAFEAASTTGKDRVELRQSRLKIEVLPQGELVISPEALAEGDNQVMVQVYNHSQDICKGFSIRLISVENIQINRGQAMRFPPLEPNTVGEGAVHLMALSGDSASVKLRCSWKQQRKPYYRDEILYFEIAV